MGKDNHPAMTQEDHLKAILYQFIKLHDRWAEERQTAAKQGADMAELLTQFTEQVKGFKELEPHVRKQIAASVQKAVSDVTQEVSDGVFKAGTYATEQIARDLQVTVSNAQKALQTYQAEVKIAQWKTIGIAALTTIATCLLLVKFLIPEPSLALTDQQVNDLHGGQAMRVMWPTLSKEEQQHWLELIDQGEHSKQIGNNIDNN